MCREATILAHSENSTDPVRGTASARHHDVTADLFQLFVLAMPVAAIAWTITHEDVFEELRDYCVARSRRSRSLAARKFFYVFTCEYCFSHWVTLAVLAITGFRLVYDDWRGYLVSGFSLVWVANHYMSLFGRLRLGIKSERVDITLKENVARQTGGRRNTA
jgi:hypothetical protein